MLLRRIRGVLHWWLGLAACVALSPGCGDSRPTSPRAPGWTATETSPTFAKDRAAAALRLQAPASASGDPAVRESAIRASTIGRVPIEPSLRIMGNDPWFVRLAGAVHRSELGGNGPDPEVDLSSLCAQPEVASEPEFRRLVANALGCDFFRRYQRSRLPGVQPEGLTELLDRAIEQFRSASGSPEACVNEAAALLERARRDPATAARSLAEAGAALDFLESDSIGVPWQPGMFLGLPARGPRIAIVVDVSSSMPAQSLEAAKRALMATIGSLEDGARLGVWTFGPGVRGLAVTDAEPLAIRGGPAAARDARPAVEALFSAPAASGSDGLLAAVAAAAFAKPSGILVLAAPGSIGPSSSANKAGLDLAKRGILVDACVVAPAYSGDPSLQERCRDGALGLLVRHTGGRMRVLLGEGARGLSGQSVRELAEREGRWTPSLARQYHAVRSLATFLSKPARAGQDPGLADLNAALLPLSPDPVVAVVGPAGSDVRCLMLGAALAFRGGDLVAADAFLRSAAEIAGAESSAPDADPVLARTFREQGARAELLRALSRSSRPEECIAHARAHQLLVGSWSHDSWSARLLSVSEGMLSAYRAGRSLSDDPAERSRQESELALVRAAFRGGALPAPGDGAGSIPDWNDPLLPLEHRR